LLSPHLSILPQFIHIISTQLKNSDTGEVQQNVPPQNMPLWHIDFFFLAKGN
jgi:hypothetical protein